MLVSTKGRYAMRLMAYIANTPDRNVTLREVSKNEEISLKYLEQLAHAMVQANLLTSARGHGGGHKLARDPHDITAGDIIRAAEGTSTSVACAALAEGETCPREEICPTADFWAGLDRAIDNYVDGVSLASFVESDTSERSPVAD